MNCDNGNEEGEDASVCQEVLRRGGEGPSVCEYGERLDKGGWKDRRQSENTINKSTRSMMSHITIRRESDRIRILAKGGNRQGQNMTRERYLGEAF